MPLLQETHSKRDLLNVKTEVEEVHPSSRVPAFPGHMAISNAGMFTPSQLLVASQTAALMAASGLGLPGANPAAFFHPGLFASWGASLPPNLAAASSPPSPGPASPQLSPAALAIRQHNNNNVVSSSSPDLSSPGSVNSRAPKRKYKKVQEPSGELMHEVPLSPPSSTGEPGKEQTPGAGSAGGSRDKQFTCGVCNRSFGYKHVLQNHERTHTGEKPFECPECHKRFTRDHHLKTHMRLHTGERPYHCEYCDRQFVQVANLRRHLRVHTGERPYACQYCTARFSDSNQLKAHVLIHKGEKPFECSKCGGRFRRRHHLLHHKCGRPQANSSLESCSPPTSDLSDELPLYEGIRARLRVTEPLVSLPLRVDLPEQTEPEDLSMSTGLHSHSSGDSPRSCSPDEPDSEDYEELDDAAALLLQRRTGPS